MVEKRVVRASGQSIPGSRTMPQDVAASESNMSRKLRASSWSESECRKQRCSFGEKSRSLAQPHLDHEKG
jgi:hypothetical protein